MFLPSRAKMTSFCFSSEEYILTDNNPDYIADHLRILKGADAGSKKQALVSPLTEDKRLSYLFLLVLHFVEFHVFADCPGHHSVFESVGKD